MAIKINWKDLAKRIINWVEVEKVMANWVQIRPETQYYFRLSSMFPPTYVHIVGEPTTMAVITIESNWTIWNVTTTGTASSKVTRIETSSGSYAKGITIYLDNVVTGENLTVTATCAENSSLQVTYTYTFTITN